MSKLDKRKLENRDERAYEGEEAASRVVLWLNGKGDNNSRRSRERIQDLLECLREVIALVESVPQDFNWPNAGLSKFHRPRPEGFDELENELHSRLSIYVTYPAFETYVWGPEWGFDDVICGRTPAGESVAAHSIIAVAKLGLLDRIRMCDCGKWFFARFLHQRSCSATCRRHVYEKTQKFKAKRRKYMREYYRLKKSGKVK
jgi:hypothetical protein